MLKTRISLNISLNIAQEGEIADMKFFFEKLINTGFLEGSALKSVIGWIQSHLNFGLLTDYLFSLQGRRHPKKTKKNTVLGKLSQIFEPTHPPQGFYEIWKHERWNSGQKRRFLGWFGHIWYLIFKNYFWQKTANRNSNNEIEPLSYILFINTMSVLAQVCEIIEQAVGNLFVQGTFSSMVVSIVIGVSKLRWKSNLPV